MFVCWPNPGEAQTVVPAEGGNLLYCHLMAVVLDVTIPRVLECIKFWISGMPFGVHHGDQGTATSCRLLPQIPSLPCAGQS